MCDPYFPDLTNWTLANLCLDVILCWSIFAKKVSLLCNTTTVPSWTDNNDPRCKSLPNLLTALPHPCQWTLQPAQIQSNPGRADWNWQKEPLRWDLSNGSCKRSDGAAEQSGEISNWDPREPGGDSSSYLNLCGILIVGQQSLTDFHFKILDNILNTPM